MGVRSVRHSSAEINPLRVLIGDTTLDSLGHLPKARRIRVSAAVVQGAGRAQAAAARTRRKEEGSGARIAGETSRWMWELGTSERLFRVTAFSVAAEFQMNTYITSFFVFATPWPRLSGLGTLGFNLDNITIRRDWV
jgi:hypothetical protein